jgi:hypothetical protein
MGWFRVTREMLMNDPMVAREIFNGLIIHDLHRHFDYGQCTMYLAEGEQFDDLAEGDEAPRYELAFSEAGAITFQRVGKHLAAGAFDPDRGGDAVL